MSYIETFNNMCSYRCCIPKMLLFDDEFIVLVIITVVCLSPAQCAVIWKIIDTHINHYDRAIVLGNDKHTR